LSDQPVAISGSASGTYRYDGNFKRVKSVVNPGSGSGTGGKTIYNVYDAGGTLVHIDNVTDGKKTDYIKAGSLSIARIENNVPTYLHNDHLGSAQTGTNAAGNGHCRGLLRLHLIHWIKYFGDAEPPTKWREKYTPYGSSMNNSAANDNQAGFTGHIKDSATGLKPLPWPFTLIFDIQYQIFRLSPNLLQSMQARYYDSLIGRFLSIDPVGFTTRYPGSFNRYTYTLNDPVNMTDPDGECPWCVAFVVNTAFSAVIQYAETGSVDLGKAVVEGALDTVNPASAVSKAKKVVKLAKAAKGGKSAKGKCCFVAGTLVETKDGLRPIEELDIGDLVLAKDVESGEIAYKEITDLIRRHDRIIWKVVVETEDKQTEVFETTDDHPWWIPERGWVTIEELSSGDIATTADGDPATIISVTETSRLDATYNITVADFETYFVGKQKVLVHNCKNKLKKAQPSKNPGAGRKGGATSGGKPHSKQKQSKGSKKRTKEKHQKKRPGTKTKQRQKEGWKQR
jgi:RHS repeat-associated protein